MNVAAETSIESKSQSERAYDQIKRDILGAVLVPEEKLQIEAMSARYAVGINPVREALNRLSSEGWVERKSQRGFFVSSMSMADLEELVLTRIWLETKALTESMSHASEAWEERLVVGYHRLARTQRQLETNIGPQMNEQWERLHKDFHMLLLELCGSSWLLGFCSTMMDQAVRYRNLSVNTTQARRGDALVEHQQILDAVLERDAARATRLLQAHYTTTLEGLRAVLK